MLAEDTRRAVTSRASGLYHLVVDGAPFLVIFLFVGVAIALPLGAIIMMSFRAGNPLNLGGYTLDNYRDTYVAGITYSALLNSVIYTFVSLLISMSIATLFAWLVERTDMPFRNAAWILLLLPIGIPSFLVAVAWLLLLNPQVGEINILLREIASWIGISMESGPIDIYSLGGMIFVNSVAGGTTIFLLMVGAFRLMSVELEEAGYMSGAQVPTVVRRITLRVLAPAVWVAVVYKLASDFNDIDIPLLLGLQDRIYTLPTLVYFTAFYNVPTNWGLATAVSSPIVLIAMGMTYVYYRVVIRQSHLQQHASVSGKGIRTKRVALGKWRKPAFGAFVLWFTLSTVAPVGILLWASLLPAFRPFSVEAFGQLTFDQYRALFASSNFIRLSVNTVVLAVSVATPAVILGILISWIVVRTRTKGRFFLDAVVFVPHVLPGSVLAAGLVFVFLHPTFRPLGLYGSMWIMVLAMLAGFMPFLTRMFNGSLALIHKELEESARMSGVSRLGTLIWVVGPIIFPTIVAAWVWVAVHAARSLTIPLMLSSNDTQTLSVLLFFFIDRDADFSAASALGMVLLGATTVLLIATRKFIRGAFGSDR